MFGAPGPHENPVVRSVAGFLVAVACYITGSMFDDIDFRTAGVTFKISSIIVALGVLQYMRERF